MMMKGPLRELIPVDKQEVRIRVPQDAKVEKVRLLVSDTDSRVQDRRWDCHAYRPLGSGP